MSFPNSSSFQARLSLLGRKRLKGRKGRKGLYSKDSEAKGLKRLKAEKALLQRLGVQWP